MLELYWQYKSVGICVPQQTLWLETSGVPMISQHTIRVQLQGPMFQPLQMKLQITEVYTINGV